MVKETHTVTCQVKRLCFYLQSLNVKRIFADGLLCRRECQIKISGGVVLLISYLLLHIVRSMSSESLLSEHEREENQTAGSSNSIMEARSEHQKSKMYNSIYSFTTAMGTGLVFLVLFWILHYRGGFAWQSKPDIQFNWHPFLMLLGMVFLYSQAILIYRTGRSMPKMKLKLIHAGFHLLAFIFSVIGLKAVFDSHNLALVPRPNLYSLHSWVGLITVIIYSIQFLAGFVSFLYPGLSSTLRKSLLPVHVIFGTFAFVMGLISAMTGLTEKVIFTLGSKYSEFVPEAFVFNFIGLIVTFYGLLVLYLVTDSTYKRNALPEDELALTRND